MFKNYVLGFVLFWGVVVSLVFVGTHLHFPKEWLEKGMPYAFGAIGILALTPIYYIIGALIRDKFD